MPSANRCFTGHQPDFVCPEGGSNLSATPHSLHLSHNMHAWCGHKCPEVLAHVRNAGAQLTHSHLSSSASLQGSPR